MRIGIGCTTYKRPRHYELWCNQIDKFDGEDYLVVGVSDGHDGERKGIAARKNECLSILKDCDYYFLFDDDCFPIKEGWAEWIIEASKASGQKHMMYLRETPTIKKIKTINAIYDERECTPDEDLIDIPIDIFNNCAGCMMFMTKEVIEKVGGYNPAYGIYGFEHAGYSNRIHAAGLTPLGAYTCPAGIEEYIYSMDYDYSRREEFQKKVNHAPSLKDEIKNIPTYTALNKVVYDHDTQIYQPL